MSEYILCLSFWVWITSLRMFFFFVFVFCSIHLPPNFKMSLFCCYCYSRIVLHCVNVPHFLYPFFSWGASRLFPGSDYTNNAAMNIVEQMQKCKNEFASFDICQRVVLLGLTYFLFSVLFLIISFRCITVVYAVEHLFNVWCKYVLHLFKIIEAVLLCLSKTPDWSNKEPNGQ